MLSHNIYLIDLPILVVLVSLVYSATRFDEWSAILRQFVSWVVRLAFFLGGIGLLLYLVSRF
jgi:integral membrane sensor domain MASE1